MADASRIVTASTPRKIVALSPRGGRPVLLRQIRSGEVVSPTASEDGDRIAFVVQRDKRLVRREPDVYVLRDEVWTMRGDGSGAHPILAFVRKRKGGRGEGETLFPPDDVPGGAGSIESLDISADGRRLVLVRGYEAFYTLDVGGRHLRYLRTTGAKPQGYLGDDCCGPQFTPDGRRIVGHFEAKRKEGIGTVPVEGGKVRFLLDHGYSATYSDDGRRIAFVAELAPPKDHPHWRGETAIWLMNPDGSGAHPAITGMGGIENPDFSPDSRRLTFSGTAPGPCPGICIGESRSHTYVARLDGGGVRAIGTGLAGFNSENPQWVR